MRRSAQRREPALDPAAKPGGRATVLFLALLVAFAVSAVSASIVFQWPPSAAERQAAYDAVAEQEAKATLEELGLLVISDPLTGHVHHVDFLERKDLNDAIFQKLVALRQLRTLNLDNSNITDAQVRHVGNLPTIEGLLLADTQISDNGLAHLAELSNLRGLYLAGTRISNQGVQHLAGLRDLWVLDLTNTLVTEEGLAHLRRMHQLRVLMLSKITDEGVPYVMDMQNLKHILVNENKMSDRRLKQLKKALPRLARRQR